MADKKPTRRWVRTIARLGVIGLAASAVGVGLLGWQYKLYVLDEPGDHIAPEHIRGIIAQESPVYFRDGKTRVGVFFEDEHRQLVPFERLPTSYVAAIVAAEDGDYWSHPGVSVKHITRAMLQNLKAGNVVAGGSTLTQQSAKNLYYRPDRSLRSKGVELVNALRLEAHYSKAEILSFYANQFHVAGNGRGIGIAARYFFDDDVEDLNLLQSAFLAGLVKGPSNYDPFVGSPERQEKARKRAHERTEYVLRRMIEESPESLAGPYPDRGDAESLKAYQLRVEEVRELQIEAKRLLDEGFELPFKKGTFRYDSNAVLDEVGRRLREPPFDTVLKEAGIADPDTAGLVVVTTLDADAQREAVYSLWHHLTEVGAMLEGASAASLVHPDTRPPNYEPERSAVTHEFRVAQVVKHRGEKGKKFADLDLGGKTCVLDRQGLERVATTVWRGRKRDRTARPSASWVDTFLTELPEGSVVFASVREVPPEGDPLCDLEFRPELQGSVVVLEDGQVRAMVGGNDNRNFNRATALRQLGSTWKPLIYHSALELGWSPLDRLDNTRNVFPFSTTFYYPSPDHAPDPTVSMSWSGVNSENLASVWLLYHLTDRLTPDQVASLATAVGLARNEGESEKDYQRRIQKGGILPTAGRVREGVFLRARTEVASSLEDPDEALALWSMLYGWGFSGERSRGGNARALSNSWLSVEGWADSCAEQYARLEQQVGEAAVKPETLPDLTYWVDGNELRVACGQAPEGATAWLPEFAGVHSAKSKEESKGLFAKWFGGEEDSSSGLLLADAGKMRIDDRISLGTLQQVQQAIARREAMLDVTTLSNAQLYEPDFLYWHQDFRVLLGMKYVARLAREYGVRTEIQEVMSMPLGASEVTLEEQTAVYEGITTGLAWDFPGRVPSGLGGTEVPAVPAPTLLIAEIRDVDGRVLYRAEPESRVVAPPAVAQMTADILRNVVLYGTGRRAMEAVDAGVPLPVLGKTGTTNDYRNVAFIGTAPRWLEGTLFSVEDGFTVGVYVGYDDNRPMEAGNIRLAGASGALPAWIGTVQGLMSAGLLGRATEQGESVLRVSDELTAVVVDPNVGLPVQDPAPTGEARPVTVLSRPAVVAPENWESMEAEPERPVRIAPSVEDAAKQERVLDDPNEIPSVWDEP